MQKCITFISLSAEGNFISLMLDAKNLMQKSDEKQKIGANISLNKQNAFKTDLFMLRFALKQRKF
jgi:hypothetical protein